ncbi:hypothetical protein [Funiculus sociatus]|uniref:hypothetical protein n=1 Tax=Funiculus sociatus TaxID=450527 RepID=UPI003299E214
MRSRVAASTTKDNQTGYDARWSDRLMPHAKLLKVKTVVRPSAAISVYEQSPSPRIEPLSPQTR